MTERIPYNRIDYYSDLILDYLAEKESIKFAYHRFPKLENFKKQLEEKGSSFSSENRKILVSALENQYGNTDASKLTKQNIESLGDEKAFTITTGHQLNLFTGPLYFLYKIISVINLTRELKKAYPDYNFVPIHWMASEDHDFEEINFFNLKDKKIQWKSNQTGAVGPFSTRGLAKVHQIFSETLNNSENADVLREAFKEAYLKHETLTEATRYLANKFLGKYGLVVIDGDDIQLKKIFAPYVKRELLEQPAFHRIGETAEKLEKLGYKIQVNPREINLFYLSKNSRDRLVLEDDLYFVHETEKRFTREELLGELKEHPEKFSPNAIMRPLYQEVILPNLCYIGGSGELAYWLELKTYFEGEGVVFPILLQRNSALLITEKQQKRKENLKLSVEDLFMEQLQLLNKQVKAISDIPIDFSDQRQYLKKQFEDLYVLAEKTDKSFLGAVAAQEKKQLNGLAHLEKRLLKAQKRKLKDELHRTEKLQNELFPKQNLQERTTNFSEFYEVYGDGLIETLFKELKPLDLVFDVITL